MQHACNEHRGRGILHGHGTREYRNDRCAQYNLYRTRVTNFQLRDDFQESVEMSTYLVAFVVCDFKRVSELTKRNISVSVYASEAMLPQARYAVTTAARIMDYFESFFGVHYPLPKQGSCKMIP